MFYKYFPIMHPTTTAIPTTIPNLSPLDVACSASDCACSASDCARSASDCARSASSSKRKTNI